MNEQLSVVIDIGSEISKAGFGGDEEPKSIFRSVIGRYKSDCIIKSQNDFYIGDEAYRRRKDLDLAYPYQYLGGNEPTTLPPQTKCSIEDLEEFLSYTYSEQLRVPADEQPALFLESHANTTSVSREMFTQLIFEKFNSPALYLAMKSPMALFATGYQTGIVIQSGNTTTNVTPIYNGNIVRHGVKQLNVGGRDISNYLNMQLNESSNSQGADIINDHEYEIVRQIKEKHCYVSLDYDRDITIANNSNNNIQYELPDGKVITIGNERIQCSESLFRPKLIGIESDGIHKIIYDSIMSCDFELRRDLFRRVLLSGGTTLLPGISNRLQKELTNLASRNVFIKVVSPSDRQHLPWIGGSIFSSLSTFPQHWVSKQDYEESGASIINKKCPI